MIVNNKNNCIVPADVPAHCSDEFRANYAAITKSTGRLMLFACDQKIEHLNRDFYGPSIDPADNDPKHLFEIASKGTIGAFATHLGLIARYGACYPTINYIAKMNGKTDLVKTQQKDPYSALLWNIEQLLALKKNAGLSIRGIGYTVYPGSEYESSMLEQAAQLVYHAHQHGLVAIVWVYPRGKAVADELCPEIIAGAAGLAASLGADFVKLNMPHATAEKTSIELLKIAVQAAGNTKVIISGGTATEPTLFLKELYEQLHGANTAGNATGRNIHQRSLQKAVSLTHAIAALVFENASLEHAIKLAS